MPLLHVDQYWLTLHCMLCNISKKINIPLHSKGTSAGWNPKPHWQVMLLSPARESIPNQKPDMQHHKWNIFTVPISSCSLLLLLLSRPTECQHLHWFHCHWQHCLSPAILSSTQHHQDILASGLTVIKFGLGGFFLSFRSYVISVLSFHVCHNIFTKYNF